MSVQREGGLSERRRAGFKGLICPQITQILADSRSPAGWT